ncbi:SGNH/GDSL hydrolase family protein [Nitrospira sp. Kam-Ns4a]
MKSDESVPLIVCFGDSLTAGYQAPTLDCPSVRETPYGVFLRERLAGAARVAVSGVCGEVTADMAARFGADALAAKPAFVIILGGTNDLGWWLAPRDILQNLVAMYEQALAAGTQPIAVTVPSIRIGGEPGTPAERAWEQALIAPREALNRMIAEFCAGRGLACVDLFQATLEPGTRRLARAYSNDGLHLTTDGYRRFADLLYHQVFRPLGSTGHGMRDR